MGAVGVMYCRRYVKPDTNGPSKPTLGQEVAKINMEKSPNEIHEKLTRVATWVNATAAATLEVLRRQCHRQPQHIRLRSYERNLVIDKFPQMQVKLRLRAMPIPPTSVNNKASKTSATSIDADANTKENTKEKLSHHTITTTTSTTTTTTTNGDLESSNSERSDISITPKIDIPAATVPIPTSEPRIAETATPSVPLVPTVLQSLAPTVPTAMQLDQDLCAEPPATTTIAPLKSMELIKSWEAPSKSETPYKTLEARFAAFQTSGDVQVKYSRLNRRMDWLTNELEIAK
ncbi:hypothetical protein HDU76_011051 [Blyttiomyces sp. JEL0837]|nr:hypothetical protein HDU76_011051 [Blyttiomyces sp. JEL0837]